MKSNLPESNQPNERPRTVPVPLPPAGEIIPAVAELMKKPGIHVCHDPRHKGIMVALAVFDNGEIHALAPTHVIDPRQFYPDVTFDGPLVPKE